MGLVVEHINKSFGQFQAIQDLSMEVKEGSIFGFLGANGAGKTTTMLMRIGAGGVAWWEIVITVVLMIITIFICTVVSARIYRFGILMYGQRPGLRQLVKLVRSK